MPASECTNRTSQLLAVVAIVWAMAMTLELAYFYYPPNSSAGIFQRLTSPIPALKQAPSPDAFGKILALPATANGKALSSPRDAARTNTLMDFVLIVLYISIFLGYARVLGGAAKWLGNAISYVILLAAGCDVVEDVSLLWNLRGEGQWVSRRSLLIMRHFSEGKWVALAGATLLLSFLLLRYAWAALQDHKKPGRWRERMRAGASGVGVLSAACMLLGFLYLPLHSLGLLLLPVMWLLASPEFRASQAREAKPRAAGDGSDYMQQIATGYIRHMRDLEPKPAEPPLHSEIRNAISQLYDVEHREAAVGLWEQRDERSIELLTALLYRDPKLAVSMVESQYADCPEFLVQLKNEANRPESTKAWWQPWKHDPTPAIREVVRQYTQGEVREADLLEHPEFVYQLARAAEVAVPFSLVLHFELDEIERSRALRLKQDRDAEVASLQSMVAHLSMQVRASGMAPETQEAGTSKDAPAASVTFAAGARPSPEAIEQVQERIAEITKLLQSYSSPTSEVAEPAPAALEPETGKPKGISFPPNRALQADLVGLAFSGGGIRSATFNLGILQALAELDVLRFVDYLSAVSGGSYIASWLAAWSKRQTDGILRVQRWLAPFRSPDPSRREVFPIWFLRKYSNYLTPRASMFSADTWTMAAIWLRNTALNLIILLLSLITVLVAPHWASKVAELNRITQDKSGLAIIAAILLAAGILAGASLANFERDRFGRLRRGASSSPLITQSGIQWTIVVPLMLAAWIGAMCLTPKDKATAPPWTRDNITEASFVILWLALFMAQLWGRFQRCFYDRDVSAKSWRWRRWADCIVVICSALAAAAGGVFIGKSAVWMAAWPDKTRSIETFGPSLLLAGLAAMVTVQIGLLGVNFPDERREWWARLTAWLIIYSLAWAGLFGVSLFGHDMVKAVASKGILAWHRIGGWMALLAWAGSTIWGLVVGYSSKTPASGPVTSGKATKVAMIGAPYVFIIGLLFLLSYGTEALLRRNPCVETVWLLPLCILTSVLLVLLASWRIDVNEFSMHHFYRNRLIRAYLGASHEGRIPNRFTGFDRTDDIPIAELQTQAKNLEELPSPYYGPYLLVNTTMNVVKGEELAFQERKAESFTFGPLYSGCEYVGSKSGYHGNLEPFGYRPTNTYAFRGNGIGLGTTMAISGAAINPNMGYQSSPPLAFLMTLFDVRLGWWLGNPHHRRTWRRHSPRCGLLYLLTELMGSASATSAYINLSDGGHFENMGLYELVRRRCRFIILCDAEEDAKFGFEGLGNAVRKCRTDFNVDIILPLQEIRPVKLGKGSHAHCGIGQIHYPGAVPEYGVLLYIKPSLTNDEPDDVREYAWHHTEFPHQTTLDQWFNESQFESYRALGYHIGRKTFDLPLAVFKLPEKERMRAIFEHLWKLWTPPPGKKSC